MKAQWGETRFLYWGGSRPKFGRMAIFYFVQWWCPMVVGRSCRMVICFFYRSMFDVQRGLGPAEWLFPFCSVSNVQWVSAKVRPNGHLSYCPVLDAESVCWYPVLTSHGHVGQKWPNGHLLLCLSVKCRVSFFVFGNAVRWSFMFICILFFTDISCSWISSKR